MKYAFVIARVLLGLVFTVFGLNGFLHFFPNPPVPGLAGQFMGALLGSHYYVIAFGTDSSAVCCCSATATCRSH